MTGVGLAVPQLGEGIGIDLVREFCQRAESLGYTSLWVQEHFMWPLEPARGYGGRVGAPIPAQYRSVLAPTELLAAMTTWTSQVKLGTSILVAGNHWPVPLAQRLSTLDLLSSGRLLAGFGVGWNAEEHAASGTDVRTRGARMDEFIVALKSCWGDDPVRFEGRFFDIPPSVIRPKPLQRPHPPLLSGMWSTAGLERTRKWFDAWNPAGLPVPTVVARLAEMNASRPEGMAPLDVYHRVFAQFPHQPTPEGDTIERLTGEAGEAAGAGFNEVILEHNFWSEIRRPEDWLDIPERFLPVLEAARV